MRISENKGMNCQEDEKMGELEHIRNPGINPGANETTKVLFQ
jgi:hypothetical protein